LLVDEKMSAGVPKMASADSPWRVYKSTNAESIISSGIPNPRDVTMDSSATASTFHIRFTPMEEAIPLCLGAIDSLNQPL
jgi:hypothetical protein